MTERFTTRLRDRAEPIWRAQHEHPFVRGIGQALRDRGLPADRRYAKWIEMYADPEFARLADWCRALVDRLAERATSAQAGRLEEAFLTSSRYEYLFWEMARRREAWPV